MELVKTRRETEGIKMILNNQYERKICESYLNEPKAVFTAKNELFTNGLKERLNHT